MDLNGLSGSFTVTKPSGEEKPSSGGGIPGFPYESIILGLVVAALILWMLQRRQ